MANRISAMVLTAIESGERQQSPLSAGPEASEIDGSGDLC